MNNLRNSNIKKYIKNILLLVIVTLIIFLPFVRASQDNDTVIETRKIEAIPYIINENGESVSTENPNNTIHTESAIINEELENVNKEYENKFEKEQKRIKIGRTILKVVVVIISLAILVFVIINIIKSRNKKQNNININMNRNMNSNIDNNIKNNNNNNPGNIF